MSIKKFIGSALVFAFALVAFGGTSDAAYVHTMTLKQGSTGSQVMALQQTLNMTSCKVAVSGVGSTGWESTSFGPMTKAAVQCFQAANGLTADGVVGSMTGAKLSAVMGGTVSGNFPVGCSSAAGYSTVTGQPCVSTSNLPAGCSSTSGYSPVTGAPCNGSSTTTPSNGSLSGTDGSIQTVDSLSQYSDEEVGEGQSDVKVAGFEVEASNDGDIALRSVKLVFDPTGNDTGDSDHLDDYIESVSVWMGSTKVGSADADDFSENSNDTFSKSITLSNAIVRADETEKFYISVDAVNSFDSSDIDSDEWSVGIENIRIEDGSGVVSTDDSSFTTGADEIGWDSTGDGMEIDFVDFGTAADTELKITTDTDSPDAGIVIVDTDDSTDNVVLLKGKLKLDGTSDVTIDEFPVTLTTTGATDVDYVTGSLTLVLDGEEYTESVSTSAVTSATVTFNNLDYTLEAGDTVSFEVRADINEVDDVTFDEGDTLLASVTSTNRGEMDAENEEGDQLSASERTGTATGEAQEFRSEGISVTLVSTTADKSASDTNNADTATFTIKFKVTAVGDDVYLATTAATGVTYAVDASGTTTTGDLSAVLVNNTDTDVTSGGTWLVEEGQSETITLTVLRSASDTDGLYRALLTGVLWDTDDDTTPDNTYSSNLDDFKTEYVDLD